MYWMLESNNRGYKVVYSPNGIPRGGTSNSNWKMVRDGLNGQEAEDLVQRLTQDQDSTK